MEPEARPGAAPSLPAAAAACSVQCFVFSRQYRRICLVARVLTGAAVLSAVFWVAVAWGGMLPSWAWYAIGMLAVTGLLPLIFARSPRSVELMWRTHLKDNGEPVSGAWCTGLVTGGAVQNVPLLWWWLPVNGCWSWVLPSGGGVRGFSCWHRHGSPPNRCVGCAGCCASGHLCLGAWHPVCRR